MVDMLDRSVGMAPARLGRMLSKGKIALVCLPWIVGCGAVSHNDPTSVAGGAGFVSSGGATSNVNGGSAGVSGSATVGGYATNGGTTAGMGGGVAPGGRSSGGNSSSASGGALGGLTGGGGVAGESGNSNDGGANDAGMNGSGGANAVSCTGRVGTFPDFDRSCSSASDCVLVAHTTSCCGSTLVMAIASTESAAFARAEATCDAEYPACGCASFGIDIEDGTRIASSWQTQVKAACDGGSCKAHYAGSTFACGEQTCTDQQYCAMSSGGPAGTEPSANCEQTECSDCACLKVDAACTCSVDNGHLVVSCQRA